jgi:subtilisin family serine protease
VGADIINSSLGYTTYDDPGMDHTWDDLDGNTNIVTIGADLAARKGILPVNSAGNEGSSSWQYISSPADGDSVFAIGATNIYGEIAGFSSRGYPLDPRVKPNICAVGSGTTVADAYNDYITTSNGTSFSSPTIAGMTACLWQANPGFTNQDMMNALQFSASQASDPDNVYGYGIPDYFAANALVGIEQKKAESKLISVFPNPVSDFLNLQLDMDLYEISIFDINANLVYQSKQHTKTVNVKNLSAGMYMFRITSEGESFTGKFVK